VRRLSVLIAIAIICALPGNVLAHWQPGMGAGPHGAPCDMQVEDEVWAFHQALCLTGVAVKVSPNGMKVRPQHGSQRKVRFDWLTLFETDSGEGGLDGLVSGDYVCVDYVPHPGAVTALVVAFDPVSMPCGGMRHHSPDGER
jgi:hypothetical protein